MHRYGVTPEALSPLLAEAGSVFEHAAVTQLAADAPVTDRATIAPRRASTPSGSSRWGGRSIPRSP